MSERPALRVATDILACIGAITAIAAVFDPLIGDHAYLRLRAILVVLTLCLGASIVLRLASTRTKVVGALASVGLALALSLFLPKEEPRPWVWVPTASEVDTVQAGPEETSFENYKAGMVKYLQRDFTGALEAFTLAERDEAIAPYALNRKANIFRVQKKYDQAEQAYRAAITRSKHARHTEDRLALLSNSWNDIGWTLRRQADEVEDEATRGPKWRALQDEASSAFLKAVEITPRMAKAWHNAAQVCFDRGELAKARENSLKALSVDPEYYRPAFNLAVIAAMEGNEGLALDWLERTLQIDAAQVHNAKAGGKFSRMGDQARLQRLYREAERAVADSSNAAPTTQESVRASGAMTVTALTPTVARTQ